MKSLLEISARTLALLWAGFWTYFFVAESYSTGAPTRIAIAGSGTCLLLIVLAFVPWRWEKTGGFLLIAVALAVGAVYAILAPHHLTTGVKALTTALLAVPPLIAGVLFLLHRRVVPRHA
jgi:peptidoglycan/LPS O-acetylase OafA/YrhL